MAAIEQSTLKLDLELDHLPSTCSITTEPTITLDPTSTDTLSLAAAATMAEDTILRITLSGPNLLLVLLALILSVHLLSPTSTALLISLAPLPSIVQNDYKAFLSLGPGGVPATFTSYCRSCLLRLFILRDIYTAPSPLPSIRPLTGYLTPSSLPKRAGPRPKVRGLAPQRQLNQRGSTSAYLSLRSVLSTAPSRNPLLRTGTSCQEKHGLALFTTRDVNKTCNGEIVHVHDSDRSMHMNLHPADAAIVLQQGWGQRHPLAKGGWMTRFVPREFMMIYAPRDEAELEAVVEIVRAAAWWVGGVGVVLVVPPVEGGEGVGVGGVEVGK